MSIRRKVIERSAQATVSRVLRSRRNLAPVDSEGDVVSVEEEDIALTLLKSSPVSTSPFRGGE